MHEWQLHFYFLLIVGCSLIQSVIFFLGCTSSLMYVFIFVETVKGQNSALSVRDLNYGTISPSQWVGDHKHAAIRHHTSSEVEYCTINFVNLISRHWACWVFDSGKFFMKFDQLGSLIYVIVKNIVWASTYQDVRTSLTLSAPQGNAPLKPKCEATPLQENNTLIHITCYLCCRSYHIIRVFLLMIYSSC